MSSTNDLIETAMMKLVHHERFFANLLLNMTRTYTTDIPTVGVNVTETVNLYVNPYFWSSLTIDEQVDILKHECYHVLNNHFSRFKDLEPEMFADKKRSLERRIEDSMNASSLNKGADAAINEYLPNLPKKMKMFDKAGKVVTYPATYMDEHGAEVPHPEAGKPVVGTPILVELLKKQFPKIEKLKNMEYYYEFFKQTQPKVKVSTPQNCPDCQKKQDEHKDKQEQKAKQQGEGQGEGEGQGDGNGQPGGNGGHSHGDSDQFCDKHQGGKGQGGGMGGGPGGNGQMTIDDHSMWQQGAQDAEYVAEKVKQVVNKAVEQSGGREAGHIPSDVVQMIEALNYKPKDWKGDLQRFVSRTSEIVMESSRKVRNRRYGILYPGIKVFPKLHLAVAIDTSGSVRDEELMQFLAEIGHISKNNVKVTIIECDCKVHAVYEYDPKKKIQIHGRGGTAFQPAFDEAKKLDIDGLIYLTDGENFEGDALKKPSFPVMWAILDGYEGRYKWGYKTKIKVTKKLGK